MYAYRYCKGIKLCNVNFTLTLSSRKCSFSCALPTDKGIGEKVNGLTSLLNDTINIRTENRF